MRSARSYGIASLVMAASFGLAGCQTVAVGVESGTANAPASVETAADGGPARLTLTEEATARVGIRTEPVTSDASGASIPYSAVVYDADGATWAFVEIEPRVYQRAPLTISLIEGGRAQLSTAPAPGAAVVTVGAAELVGVEAGISGGE